MNGPRSNPEHGPLAVRVPASTSNVGPGFDLLGIALSMFVDVEAHPCAEVDVGVERRGHADPGGDALLLSAYRRACARLGAPVDVRLVVESEIPVGRGFGSSGALVAAGLLLATARAGHTAMDELLDLGVELEGHPDNVTASLFGGCTLCHPDPGGAGPVWFHQPVHPSIAFALAWPDEALETTRARQALEPSVTFADAVENPRRLALLLEGLRTGRTDLIRHGGQDRLHVERRLALIPGSSEALGAADEAGATLATISGAGSGLVALARPETIAHVAERMRSALVEVTGGGNARVVELVTGAAAARPLSRT